MPASEIMLAARCLAVAAGLKSFFIGSENRRGRTNVVAVRISPKLLITRRLVSTLLLYMRHESQSD